MKLIHAEEQELFLGELDGQSDPETKRKIIGKLFIDVFDKYAKPIGAKFLAQGTLYPDVIESVSFISGGPSATIKSHHNVEWATWKNGYCSSVLNSTIGILGFFDPASYLGLEVNYEDFGQTLAVWGVPTGPYLVLPFLGPSTPRDFTGLMSTSLLDPTYQVGNAANRDLFRGYRMGVGVVNFRSENIEIFDDLQNNSVDYYAAVRSFYNQSRNSQISDNLEVSPSINQDSLFNDFEEFELDDTYIGPDVSISYPE